MIFSLFINFFKIILFPIALLRRSRAAPRGALITLTIDGPVVDLEPRRSGLARLVRTGEPAVSVSMVRELSKRLAEDPKPRGVLLRIESIQAGQAVLRSLRDALVAIRESGKEVLVYLPNGAGNKELYLASAATRVIAGPETSVAPMGFATEATYLKGALARAGVTPQVFAKGRYKSAGETLVREDMSEPQREQVGALLDASYEELTAAIAQGRSVPVEAARVFVDSAPHLCERAKALGMIDAVAYDDELAQVIAGPEGGEPKKVAAASYLVRRTAGRLRPLRRRPYIAVIEVHGMIVSRAMTGLVKVASQTSLVRAIRAARADRRALGVVLHIDSPGGSALASDRIHREVVRLAEKKPVVAYMSNVAASGGYYIAAAAGAIVAQPVTVTGSIGVVSVRFAVGPLLEWFGLTSSVVKRGARADMQSPRRVLTGEEHQAVQGELDAFYARFLQVVAEGRKCSVEAIAPLAEGRVYSGKDALSVGLIDHLGGVDRAVDEVRARIGAGGAGIEPRILPPPRKSVAPAALEKAEAVGALASQVGLSALPEAVSAAVHLAGERVLLYWVP